MQQFYVFERPSYTLRATLPTENAAIAQAWTVANQSGVAVDIVDSNGTIVEEFEPMP